MTGSEVLFFDRIIPSLKANSQKQAFQQITEQAAKDTRLDAKRLLTRLLTWEGKSVSSGIGGGVAIAQLTARDLDTPYMLFARLPQMIGYNAVDGAPVDLIALLLSPKQDGPYHLQRLARLSRLLRDQNFCRRLRGAESKDALQALLADPAHHRRAA